MPHDFNRLYRHHRADNTGQRADNASLGARGNQARRRRRRKEVAITGIERAVRAVLVRFQRRQGAVKPADRTGCQW